MSEQSQTTADTPSENKLCTSGCGFFGSNTTGGMCSKCWRDLQKKQGKPQGNASTASASSSVAALKPIVEGVPEAKPSPMDIESSPASSSGSEVCSPCKPVAAAAVVTQKKRKKKTSYKNMMKGILQSNTPDRDVEKDKESLRKVTGGGSFTKVDKI